MTYPEVNTYEDIAALSQAAADRINGLAVRALAERGRFYLALSGGSTPLGAYRLLGQLWSGQPELLAGIHFFWGDERLVPPDDPRSNYGQARAAMSGLSLPESHLHRIQTELGADAATEAYDRELDNLGLSDAGRPFFDCVLLGLGRDGHTASLFPDRPSLAEKNRLVVTELKPGLEPNVARITLTLPALNSTQETIFMAAGPDKAAALRYCAAPEADPNPHYPASMIKPAGGRLVFMLDQAARRA